jgi:hypothetical protein
LCLCLHSWYSGFLPPRLCFSRLSRDLFVNCGRVLQESEAESHVDAMETLGETNGKFAESLMFAGIPFYVALAF